MERLTLTGLSDVCDNPLPVALWSGGRLRLDACSQRAAQHGAGRFELGRTARSLFPERDVRAALAAMDASMETGEEVILRQRLWRWVAGENLPTDIKLIATPVYADLDAAKPVAVLTEATRACPECLGVCEGHEVAPALVAVTKDAMVEPGALGAFLRASGGLSAEEAVALAAIRQAARDAFVETAGPLVEELHLRRGGPAGLGSHLQYPQRRPS